MPFLPISDATIRVFPNGCRQGNACSHNSGRNRRNKKRFAAWIDSLSVLAAPGSWQGQSHSNFVLEKSQRSLAKTHTARRRFFEQWSESTARAVAASLFRRFHVARDFTGAK